MGISGLSVILLYWNCTPYYYFVYNKMTIFNSLAAKISLQKSQPPPVNSRERERERKRQRLYIWVEKCVDKILELLSALLRQKMIECIFYFYFPLWDS